MARLTYDLNEKQTALYSFSIKDETGVAIPGASLTALTLTLRMVPSGAIVNTRNAQNVLNLNDVTVDGAGLVTWIIRIEDVTIQNDTLDTEVHRALFVFTWTSGGVPREFTKELDLRIANLGGLT